MENVANPVKLFLSIQQQRKPPLDDDDAVNTNQDSRFDECCDINAFYITYILIIDNYDLILM